VPEAPEPHPLPLPRRPSLAARWGQFLLAMALFGIVIAMMLRSGLGLGPWDAFHAGVSRLTGITIGQASIVVGIVVLAGSMAMGVRPGIGTLANMILVGVATDLAYPLVPSAASLGGGMLTGIAYYVLAIVVGGYATGMYIGARLGAGPRDGLMVGLSARFGWPVRRVRTGIELAALVAGWGMGARLGLGTVMFMLGIGPATQWGMRRFGLVRADGGATTGTVRGRSEPGPPNQPQDRAA
jgi:uncharacterized membrane protein YczE